MLTKPDCGCLCRFS